MSPLGCFCAAFYQSNTRDSRRQILSLQGEKGSLLIDRHAIGPVVSYLTVYVAVHRVAKVHSSERILVHRAAAGVGSALLKPGKLAGLWPGVLVITVIPSMIGPEIAV